MGHFSDTYRRPRHWDFPAFSSQRSLTFISQSRRLPPRANSNKCVLNVVGCHRSRISDGDSKRRIMSRYVKILQNISCKDGQHSSAKSLVLGICHKKIKLSFSWLTINRHLPQKSGFYWALKRTTLTDRDFCSQLKCKKECVKTN